MSLIEGAGDGRELRVWCGDFFKIVCPHKDLSVMRLFLRFCLELCRIRFLKRGREDETAMWNSTLWNDEHRAGFGPVLR